MLENGNRKKRGQKSKAFQQPQKKSSRKAVVTITPDEKCKVNVQTGNVSDIEMVQYLRDMTKHFAQEVIKDASEVVGDSQEEQEAYINWRIKQSGLGQ